MDVFSLFARIGLDTSEYDKGLDDASGKTHSFGEKLKSGLATAAKVGAAGLATATAAVTALSKAALGSYGDYEQLTGGVETLFKTSSDVVMEYANNAYQTAGMSANQYMETVTSFSASLLQSLGGDTQAAAEYADMAIRDMSDNANKMGTDMEMIQNAYRGFSRANFTMLDNLALGYGGTKEEMERLLADAEKLSGVKYDISSYSDMIEAIHVVQTEMGITGTTALEASTTIEGSVASAKSAWENLVTGIGDENADLSGLITQFVDSVGTAAENIIPRVQQILVGIGDAVQTIAPVIAEQVPALIEGVLPSLLEAGVSLVNGLISGIITALPSLIELIPSLLEAGVQMAQGIFEGISSALPELKAIASEMFNSLIGFLKENLPQMISSGLEALLSFSSGFRENVGVLVDNAIELIMTLADGIVEALPDLIATVPEIISNFANAINDNAPKLLKSAAELIAKLVKGLIDNIPVIIQNMPKIIAAIVDTITAFNWLNLGKKIIDFFAQGIKGMLSSVVNVAKDIVKSITDGGGLKNLPKMALQWGKDMLDNFVKGIKDKIKAVTDAVSNVASTVKNFIGFSEPEEGPLSNFHTYAPDMMKLFAKGITNNAGLLKSAFDKSLDFGSSAIDFSTNYAGSGYIGKTNGTFQQNGTQSNGGNSVLPPITIVVQSVLDGKVIGETSYNYIQNRERAYGGAY